MKQYLIYKHTSPSGKSYIGQTNNYKKRSRGHEKRIDTHPFTQAITKYKWENFSHEILKENLTIEEANFWEAFYILSMNTIHPNGYNLQSGGNNHVTHESSKLKSSESNKKTYSKKSKEEREIQIQKYKDTCQNRSEEEKLQISLNLSENAKKLDAQRSEEQKNEIYKKQQETYNLKSQEEKLEIIERRVITYFNKSDEEIVEINNKKKQTYHSRSEEEKQKERLKKSEAAKRMWETRSRTMSDETKQKISKTLSAA
jgi:hypothetical protein